MHRTLSIPIALLALFAALEGTCAYGAFIRVDVAAMLGDCDSAELVAFAKAPTALATGLSASARSNPREDAGPPAPREFVPAAPASGASSAPTASPTHGPGSAPAAHVSTVPQAPHLLPLGRLPTEMGPRFSNPPPRNPFRPPRFGS